MVAITQKHSHRNKTLNIFEAIAAYLVVFIHFPFPGVFGNIIVAIARFSVPFFFSISGYFFYKNDNTIEMKSIPRKIKKLVKLVIVSEISYFLFYLFLNFRKTGIGFNAVKNTIESEVLNYYLPNFASRISVFAPIFNSTAWFITTLIVVYGVMYFVDKFSVQKYVVQISLILLLLSLVSTRILTLLNISPTIPYERTIPFLPLPFFMIGYYISMHRQKLCGINNKSYIGLFILGLALVVLEAINNPSYTLYFGTVLIVFAVLCFANKNNTYEPKSIFVKSLSFIGEQYGTIIYIMHMMIAVILSFVFKAAFANFTESVSYQWLFPLFVVIATTMFSVFFKYILSIFAKSRRS